MNFEYATIDDLGTNPFSSIGICCNLSEKINEIMPGSKKQPLHFVRGSWKKDEQIIQPSFWLVFPNPMNRGYSSGYLIGRTNQRIVVEYLRQYGQEFEFDGRIPACSEILPLNSNLRKFREEIPLTGIYTLVQPDHRELIETIAQKSNVELIYHGHINY